MNQWLALALTATATVPAAIAYRRLAARFGYGRRIARRGAIAVTVSGAVWWLPGLWLGYSWAGQAAGLAAAAAVTFGARWTGWLLLPRWEDLP